MKKSAVILLVILFIGFCVHSQCFCAFFRSLNGIWMLVSGNFAVHYTNQVLRPFALPMILMFNYSNVCWTGESSEDALNTSGHGWHNIVMK